MQNSTENHYETLQVSQNATQETIEKMFRFLASQFHPDAGGDKEKFNRLVAAFEILRDPAARAAHDLQLKNESQEISRLVEHSKQAGPDAALRHELLCLFYARRRQNANSPALGAVAVEKTLNVPADVIDFYLWYFRSKGWIERWESGGFAITAEGVDQIDAQEFSLANHPRIAATPEPAMEMVPTR